MCVPTAAIPTWFWPWAAPMLRACPVPVWLPGGWILHQWPRYPFPHQAFPLHDIGLYPFPAIYHRRKKSPVSNLRSPLHKYGFVRQSLYHLFSLHLRSYLTLHPLRFSTHLLFFQPLINKIRSIKIIDISTSCIDCIIYLLPFFLGKIPSTGTVLKNFFTNKFRIFFTCA
mgnify:CR=1 FL=1